MESGKKTVTVSLETNFFQARNTKSTQKVTVTGCPGVENLAKVKPRAWV